MTLYFRARKQGAQVFRMDVENRQRRLDLVPIAVVTNKGEIRPQKRTPPSEDELAQIALWVASRTETPPTGIAATIRELNLLAGWLQKDASEDEVRASSDALLMAMHDLRGVIVRRLSGLADPGEE